MISYSFKYLKHNNPNHICICSFSLGFVCGSGCRFVSGFYSVQFLWTLVMLSLCVWDTQRGEWVFCQFQREMVVGLFPQVNTVWSEERCQIQLQAYFKQKYFFRNSSSNVSSEVLTCQLQLWHLLGMVIYFPFFWLHNDYVTSSFVLLAKSDARTE